MPEFEVQIERDGWATIVADTRKEADAKARRGDFDTVRQLPWAAKTSTLKKVPDPHNAP